MKQLAQTEKISNWCYEYTWTDGLHYSITIQGTRFEADSHAQRLGLTYGGELIAVYPVTDNELTAIQNNLLLATKYESNSGKDASCIANVYAGRACIATRRYSV